MLASTPARGLRQRNRSSSSSSSFVPSSVPTESGAISSVGYPYLCCPSSSEFKPDGDRPSQCIKPIRICYPLLSILPPNQANAIIPRIPPSPPEESRSDVKGIKPTSPIKIETKSSHHLSSSSSSSSSNKTGNHLVTTPWLHPRSPAPPACIPNTKNASSPLPPSTAS